MLAAALALGAAPAAPAKDGDVRVAGTCTRASTAKLKLSDEDGRIEVEFEVDQNRVGVQVVGRAPAERPVSRRGRRRSPAAPSGSFEARMVVPNRAGADRFVATATRRGGGEVCRAQASF